MTQTDAHEDASGRSAQTRPWRRLLATAVATAAMSAVLGGGTAEASYSTTTLDAGCQHRAVTAYAPNLRTQTGWAVVWAPTLFYYSTSGWQRYLPGPAMVQSDQSWDIGSYTFSNLPAGYFYRVYDTFQWYYNGAPYGSAYVNYPVAHWLDGRAGTSLSNNETYYSSVGRYGYCYSG